MQIDYLGIWTRKYMQHDLHLSDTLMSRMKRGVNSNFCTIHSRRIEVLLLDSIAAK